MRMEVPLPFGLNDPPPIPLDLNVDLDMTLDNQHHQYQYQHQLMHPSSQLTGNGEEEVQLVSFTLFSFCFAFDMLLFHSSFSNTLISSLFSPNFVVPVAPQDFYNKYSAACVAVEDSDSDSERDEV